MPLPDSQPAATSKYLGFTWWIVWTYLGLVLGSASILFGFRHIPAVSVILVALNIWLSIYMLKFSRIAFLIATILSINPVLWIINGVYLKRRWSHPRILEEISAAAKRIHRNSTFDSAPTPSSNRTQVAKPLKGSEIEAERVSEEAIWEQALEEVEGVSRRPGLWAKCFAQAGGVDGAAKAAYISIRVGEIKTEIESDVAARDAIRRQDDERESNVKRFADGEGDYRRPVKRTCPNCHSVLPNSSTRCPQCSVGAGSGIDLLNRPRL